MSPLVVWLCAGTHVRGTFDGTVPHDILERVARVATSPTTVHDAALPHRLRIHTVASYRARTFEPTGPLEDVQLEVDEGRLRFDLRFPKSRLLAIAFWTFNWAWTIGALLLALFVSGYALSFALWGALATAPIFWLLAAWAVADERRDVTTLLTQIVTEARAQ